MIHNGTLEVKGPVKGRYFDVNANPGVVPAEEGRLYYDDFFKAYVYHTGDHDKRIPVSGNVTQRAYNNTGQAIPAGRLVSISGQDANGYATIDLTDVTVETSLDTILGVTYTDIADASFGSITLQGTIEDLDTTDFAVGSTLWGSVTEPGRFQATKPEINIVKVAHVLRSSATEGILVVNISAPGDPGVPGGTPGETNPVENVYPTIDGVDGLLANQSEQTEGYFQVVEDATADPDILFPGEVYYEKLEATTGQLTDYRRLTDQETTVVQGNRGWYVFRIDELQDNVIPVTAVRRNRISVEFNAASGFYSALVFNERFTDTIASLVDAPYTYKIRLYNQTKRRLYVLDVSNFTLVNLEYTKATINELIPLADIEIDDRLEVLFDVDNNTGSGGGGTSLTKEKNQVGHGLIVGDFVRIDGSDLAKAQADSGTNAPAIGLVVEVEDVDNFTYQVGGWTDVNLGLSDGDSAWLSLTTAGAIQTTKPTQAGEIVVYLGQQTAEGFLIEISEGYTISSGTPGGGSGDMEKATYDPTNVEGDAFDMDNMVEGSTNLIFTASERTNLANQSGENTGDEDTASIQGKRPLKTVNGESLEGPGNVEIDEQADLEEAVLGTITEAGNITGAIDIDWSADTIYRGTLTGAITFSDTNLPATGFTNMKELILTGEFGITMPSAGGVTYTLDPDSDVYDGTIDNKFTLNVIKNDGAAIEVLYHIKNLS